MLRGLFTAALFLSAAAQAQAPIGEIWPAKFKVIAGGVVEYSYDLKPLKRAGGNVDASGAHGEEKVQAFLKSLPDTATVRLKPGAPLSISAGGPLEEGPLSSTFGAVSNVRWVTEDPLGLAQAGKLMPPLHPDEPKLIVSADAVLWKVRQLEDGAAAALELELDRGRKELLQRVFDLSVDRGKRMQGNAREGASTLAARLAVALSCLDAAKVPASAKSEELAPLVKAELEKVKLPPELAVPPHSYDWTAELVCGHVRSWVLRHPFSGTRAGSAAPLTLLDIVDGDPKLKEKWDSLRARRDAFFGKPKTEPLEMWREKAGGKAGEALEDMSPFLSSLGSGLLEPPGLWAAAETPVRRFYDGMQGAERANAVEELFAAAQDGRIGAPPAADASWSEFREAAWASLATLEASKERHLEAEWRDRLATLYFIFQNSHREAKGSERERPELPPRTELKVMLKVPPHLDVEPLPNAYTRAAESLERLAAILTAQKLTALRPLAAGGQVSGGAIAAEATKLARVLRGLAWLSSVKSADEPKEVAEARKFISGWKQDATLTRDTREVFAGPLTMGDSRPHAAIAGVGRRPMAVGFSSPPSTEVVGAPPGIEVDSKGEQVYLAPVLVTVGGQTRAGALPLDAARWRKMVDTAGKKRLGAEDAFLEAVAGEKK